jgi:hypothetical protein
MNITDETAIGAVSTVANLEAGCALVTAIGCRRRNKCTKAVGGPTSNRAHRLIDHSIDLFGTAGSEPAVDKERIVVQRNDRTSISGDGSNLMKNDIEIFV